MLWDDSRGLFSKVLSVYWTFEHNDYETSSENKTAYLFSVCLHDALGYDGVQNTEQDARHPSLYVQVPKEKLLS